MKSFGRILPFLLVGMLALFTGCGDDSGTEPIGPTDIPGLIAEGWSDYRSGRYESSSDNFNAALELAEPNYWDAYVDSVQAVLDDDSLALAEASERTAMYLGYIVETLTGLGWLTIEFDEQSQGTLVFGYALAIEPEYVNALGGYAIFLQIMEEWEQSNEKANALIAVDPDWEFEHNRDIDYLDLRLIQAQNYYFLADFEASLEEALALNEIVGYQTGLSAEDFNLATIEGRAALISLIDALDDLI